MTGSSRGVGKSVALALARRGANVAVNHPGDDVRPAADVVEEIRGQGRKAVEVPFDVSSPPAVKRGIEEIVERFGRLDVLVNNAGICPFQEFFELDLESWNRVFAVNAGGVFLVSQAAASIMREGGWGRIVNVTSISGLRPTGPRQVAYCSAKAAANMLTRSLALVLAPWGITVNAVLPGTVPTDINRELLAEEGAREEIIEKTPLGRLGSPADVAETVCYLASAEAAWMTGTLFVVDGGAAI